ncbi:MAG: type III-A CRISPR-associated RAMP protein Csm4 [Dehalococcoidia bacterium]
MKLHKLTIEPKSPFITPLQSDTLFGHVAWAILYQDGEQRLAQVLREFGQDEPPFLLSEAFPEGMLPVPILPPLTYQETQTLAQKLYGSISVTTMVSLSEELKKVSKRKYMDVGTLRSIAGNLSPLTLARALLQSKATPNRCSEDKVTMHVTINRLTGTAGEGALFDHRQTFYAPGSRLTIWIKLRHVSWKDDLCRWFKLVAADGFGKRKSTGLGSFDLSEIAEGELPSAPDPNAFMTLSSYVPAPRESCSGYYRYIIKRGKLGGALALGEKVWKTPLLMFSPGSIFYTNGSLRHCYGSLVPKVHSSHADVVQYALALPLPVRIEPPQGGSL